MNVLLIDNHDSFTYNLYASIKKAYVNVVVVKNNQLTLSGIKSIQPISIIISPGPRSPLYAGISFAVLAVYFSKIPILGVCLGHQAIASLFGGKVCKGDKPMHGKVSLVSHYGDPVFNGVPEKFSAMRYHSLVVNTKDSRDLTVIARDEVGTVMGIKHNCYNLYGLQFHPESILSTYGDVILKNFLCLQQGKY